MLKYCYPAAMEKKNIQKTAYMAVGGPGGGVGG